MQPRRSARTAGRGHDSDARHTLAARSLNDHNHHYTRIAWKAEVRSMPYSAPVRVHSLPFSELRKYFYSTELVADYSLMGISHGWTVWLDGLRSESWYGTRRATSVFVIEFAPAPNQCSETML